MVSKMLNKLKKKYNYLFGGKSKIDSKYYATILNQIKKNIRNYDDLTVDELKNNTAKFKNYVQEQLAPVNLEISEYINKQIEYNNKDIGDITFTLDSMNNQLQNLKNNKIRLLDEILTKLMPYAYANVFTACKRLLGEEFQVCNQKLKWDMVPFDNQILAAIALKDNNIIEIATGEGKTLIATMPLYLYSLSGESCNVATTNYYLAQRDCEWMGKLFSLLGLSAGFIKESEDISEENSYHYDIVYGDADKFIFDYIRDNMATMKELQNQRDPYYILIDDIDMVLIDNARKSYIISGPVEDKSELIMLLKPFIEELIGEQKKLISELIALIEKSVGEKDYKHAGYLVFLLKYADPFNNIVNRFLLQTEIEEEYYQLKAEFEDDNDITVFKHLHFIVDLEKNKVELTSTGQNFFEQRNLCDFSIPNLEEEFLIIDQNIILTENERIERKSQVQAKYLEIKLRINYIKTMLNAFLLYNKDDDYIVEDEKIKVIDKQTHRINPKTRFSDGIHTAIEAKENVHIGKETQTLGEISSQFYFRKYPKIAGMTGTASSEAKEFKSIYNLNVIKVPTHKPIIRIDQNDEIYLTKSEKIEAVISEIINSYNKGIPVLVGTENIEESEHYSRILIRYGIPHEVLNAKNHFREAEIIAKAGEKNAITISTNMAGRGVDIKLGKGVTSGLYVIGTIRHESSRIDKQLRGRSGRQGDPGKSKFFISLEDDLMKLFISDRISAIIRKIGIVEGDAISHPFITKSVERAQKKIEEINFRNRCRLLDYDEALNYQRDIVYSYRKAALHSNGYRSLIRELLDKTILNLVEKYPDFENELTYNLSALKIEIMKKLLVEVDFENISVESNKKEHIKYLIRKSMLAFLKKKEEILGNHMFNRLMQYSILSVIDEEWKKYLVKVDELKSSSNIKSLTGEDPLFYYRKKMREIFKEYIECISNNIIEFTFRFFPKIQETENKKNIRENTTDKETDVVEDKTITIEENIEYPKPNDFNNLIDEFKQSIYLQTLAEHEKFIIESDIKIFFHFLEYNFEKIISLTSNDIKNFRIYCKKIDKIPPKIIDRKIKSVRQFIHFLETKRIYNGSAFSPISNLIILPKIFYFDIEKNIIYRLLFTLILLGIFRFGSLIPLPIINNSNSQWIISQNNYLFQLWDVLFLGGALNNLTLFALGVIPYILMNSIHTFTSITKKKKTKTVSFLQGVIISTILSIAFTTWLLYEKLFLWSYYNFAVVVTVLTVGCLFNISIIKLLDKYGIEQGIKSIFTLNSIIYVYIWLVDINNFLPFYLINSIILLVFMFISISYFKTKKMQINLNYIDINPTLSFIKSSYLKFKIPYSLGAMPYGSSVLFLTFIIYLISLTKLDIVYYDNVSITSGIIFFSMISFYVVLLNSIIYNSSKISYFFKNNNFFIPKVKPGDETREFINARLNVVNKGNIIFSGTLFFIVFFYLTRFTNISKLSIYYNPIIFFIISATLIYNINDYYYLMRTKIFSGTEIKSTYQKMIDNSIANKSSYLKLIFNLNSINDIKQLIPKIFSRSFLILKLIVETIKNIWKYFFSIITIIITLNELFKIINGEFEKSLLKKLWEMLF